MRVLTSRLASFCLALAAAAPLLAAEPPASSCIWYADLAGIRQARFPAGGSNGDPNAQVSTPEALAIAMADRGCAAWVRDRAGLKQYSDSGQLLAAIELAPLAQRHTGDAAAAIAAQIAPTAPTPDTVARHLALDTRDGTLWLAAGNALIHLDASGNLLGHGTTATPIRAITVDVPGTLWVLSEGNLGQHRADGTAVASHALNTHYPDVHRIAVDSLGGKLWLIGPQRVWQIDPADLDPHDAPPPAWREGVVYQAGQRVSFAGFVYQAKVTHTAHVGSNWSPSATPSLWQRLEAIQPEPAPMPWQIGTRYQAGETVLYQGRVYRALVPHTTYPGTDWTPANAPTLWREQIGVTPPPGGTQPPGEVKVIDLAEPIVDAALNPRSGELWLLGETTLSVYGWDAQRRHQAELTPLGILQPQGLRFDAAGQHFWLHSADRLTPFGVDGTPQGPQPVSTDRSVLGTTAFHLMPSLTPVEPPATPTNQTRPVLQWAYDALCNGQPCAFDPEYFASYRWQVTLDDTSIADQLIFDVARQLARHTPAQALGDGPHRLSAQVTDAWGNRSAQLDHAFVLDSQPPRFQELHPASGAVLTTATVVLSGSVDDEQATVALSNPAHWSATGTNPATHRFTWTLQLQPGANDVELVAYDAAGNSTTHRHTLTFAPPPPTPPVAGQITVGQPADGNVTLSGQAGAVAAGMQVLITNTRSGEQVTATADAEGRFTAQIAAQGGDALTLVARDPWGGESDAVALTVADPDDPIDPGIVPPDPATLAPPLDSTVPTRLADSTAFLYTGENAIQTGVAPGTIEPRRAAVLRGSVTDRDGKPLPGVNIQILNHPEYGQTHSRADGLFDLAANGGGLLTVQYRKEGYLPAQRTVSTRWQDWTIAPSVALIRLDTQATTVNLADATTMQIARGNPVTDADGARQATLLFPQGTTAQMILPDGTTQPLGTATVRATEYTVGANGPNAMPGELPPTSGYTYAVELSVDEAMAAGASSVQFSQPVYSYTDNFLEFPTGSIVPAGYYDRAKAVWIPSDNGVVIEVLAVAGGVASIDSDGDGSADDDTRLSAIGMTLAERTQLGQLYAAGKSLWRVPVRHFTPWDYNWPYGPPEGAEPPKVKFPETPAVEEKPDCESGSIIECQNQSLGESLPIVGTPFTINYRSSRHVRKTEIAILLTGNSVPPGLQRIDLIIDVAGKHLKKSFSPDANQEFNFEWDGTDAYARPAFGDQAAKVSIGYIYPAEYYQPAEFGQAFGGFGRNEVSGNSSRNEVALWQKGTYSLMAHSVATLFNMGGWSLDVNHHYNFEDEVLSFGSGSIRNGKSISNKLEVIAGTGLSGTSGDDGPATAATLSFPRGLVFGDDGALYLGNELYGGVKKILPNGIIKGVMEGGIGTSKVFDVALDRDGNVYIADGFNWRVQKITPNGDVLAVTGDFNNHQPGLDNFVPATSVAAFEPKGLAIDTGGNLYIAEAVAHRIRKVSPDGIISTIAGTGEAGFAGDGGPASEALLNQPQGMAVDSEGAIYIADTGNDRIRRIAPDGTINTVAGGGAGGLGDGGQAIAASLAQPADVTVDAQGNLYIADSSNHRIRRVAADGIISSVAQGEMPRYLAGGWIPFEGPQSSDIGTPLSVALDAQGRVHFSGYENVVMKISPLFPGFNPTDFAVPDESGEEIYQFDGDGRHIATRSTSNGVERYRFGYSKGLLSTVTDADGNITTIERSSAGQPTAIIAPNGQRTTFTLDTNGYLASVTNPASETTRMTYDSDGLMQTFTTPRDHTSTFDYDISGRLIRDLNAAGGGWHLARTELADGYQVTKRSEMGRTTTYSVRNQPDGTSQRGTVLPDQSGTQQVSTPDGTTTTTTAADGTVTTRTQGPDPRFGMQAPLTTRLSVETPSGLLMTQTHTRQATLADADNPLSLQSQTDTLTINGKSLTSVYQAAARSYTSTSPAGRQSTVYVDAQGRPLQLAQPGLLPVDRAYDAKGRLTTISQGSGDAARTTHYAYNTLGELESVTDALGRITGYAYDLAGRVTRVTTPDGREIGFGYDANGNLTAVTPPSRPAHGFDFDNIDLATRYAPPALGEAVVATRYAYNLDQQPTQIERPDGQTIDYGYDTAGRLNTVTAGEQLIAYDYLTSGQLGSIASGDIAQSFTYDGALLTGIQHSGPVSGELAFGYDNFFRLTQLGIAGVNIAYGYDDDGLLTQAGALSLTRDTANGLPTGSTLGQIATSQQYDAYGQLSSFTARHGDTVLFQEQYTRNTVGQITGKTVSGNGPTQDYGYRYDLAGRLIEVTQNGNVIGQYQYDANGNRTHTNGVAATYDAQDRLTAYGNRQYQYSANGELQQINASGAISQYRYDTLGNLRQVILAQGGQLDYVIDGQNRRIGKKVNGVLVQGFIYQDQLKPAAELNGNGQVVSRFIYAGKANVPEYLVKGGETYRIITDQLGTVRLVVNSQTGEVKQEIAYDAWGNVLSDTNPGFQPFGFAGGLYDKDTGLVRFGARDYDPQIGRWTAKDPIGFGGGDSNVYGYVKSDPVNNIDPSGLATLLCARELGSPDKADMNPAWNPVRHDYLIVGDQSYGLTPHSNMIWSKGRIDSPERKNNKKCEMISSDPKFDDATRQAIKKMGSPTYNVGAFPGTLGWVLGARNCQSWAEEILEEAKKIYKR
ncbi:carbohydrate-binding protein [Chitiniphilus eburneus]